MPTYGETAVSAKLVFLLLLGCVFVLFMAAVFAGSTSNTRNGDALMYSYGHAIQRV